MIITVYGVDRAGTPWDERENIPDASEALTLLERLRSEQPNNVYGVFDADDPERGDIEMELEEAIYEAERFGLGVPL